MLLYILMNKMKRLNLISIIIIVFVLPLFSFLIWNNNDSELIIGNWVSDGDSLSRVVFESNQCKWYYNNKLIETNCYVIQNTTPICGKDVLVNDKTNYLKLTSLTNQESDLCYEILGVTNTDLSLMDINTGHIITFTKSN